MTLTARQQTVLAFIRDYLDVKGYSPSVRDVAAWLGITAHGAECHLDALERKGAIERTPGVCRSIRIPR